jgi:hypothetical protein
MDAPETMKLFPHFIIQNANRIFSIEGLTRKLEQPL